NERIIKYKSKMFTLTYDTKLYTPLEVVERHKKDFKKLVRKIREVNSNFEYAYFIEVTKKMYLHFHVYTDTFISQKWLSDTWREITGSYIVEIHSIRTEKQKYYAVGYMNVSQKFTFEQLEFVFHNVSRLFGSSRGFFEKEKQFNNGLPFYERVAFVFLDNKDYREYMDATNPKKTYKWKEKEFDFLLANALAQKQLTIKRNVLIIHF
ncbi:MAG: hypothetical protein U9P79_06020, partial [Candidatus Cloacimonadota bacterium]|nr:hypothetical protein [Candidatus Cloacimonadota bacterium]